MSVHMTQCSSGSEEEEKWHGPLSPLVHKLSHLFSTIIKRVTVGSPTVLLTSLLFFVFTRLIPASGPFVLVFSL